MYKILSQQKKKRTFYKAFKQPLKRKQSSQIRNRRLRRPGRLYGKPAFFGSTHCLQYIPTLMTTEDVSMATTVPSHQHMFSFKIFNKKKIKKEKGGVWERFASHLISKQLKYSSKTSVLNFVFVVRIHKILVGAYKK